MKNRELINQLKEYNLNADVTLTTSEDICLSYIIGEANTGERERESDFPSLILLLSSSNHVIGVIDYGL